MPPFDRFEIGLPDRQDEEPNEMCECGNDRCRNPIYRGELNWEYYGEWYCSTYCFAKQTGAEKRYAKP